MVFATTSSIARRTTSSPEYPTMCDPSRRNTPLPCAQSKYAPSGNGHHVLHTSTYCARFHASRSVSFTLAYAL